MLNFAKDAIGVIMNYNELIITIKSGYLPTKVASKVIRNSNNQVLVSDSHANLVNNEGKVIVNFKNGEVYLNVNLMN